MDSGTKRLTHTDIFIFWFPLLATLIMMMVEGPFLAAVIARLAESKYNLAAFGVAHALASFFEAPVVMMMSAANTLVGNRNAFIKLRKFNCVLNGTISVVFVMTVSPWIWKPLIDGLMGLPQNVSEIANVSCMILLPWPALIGYRRFYQGILIRNKFTRMISYGTVIRLVTMAVIALTLYFSFDINGAYVGAAALTGGVIIEALASRLMANKLVKSLLEQTDEDPNEKPLTYKEIMRFYFPLAASTLLSIGIRPVITFFLASSRYAIESLAVYPVINGLLGIFFTFGWSYQSPCITLIGKDFEHFAKLRDFAIYLGLFAGGALAVITLTPLSVFWLGDISGLTPALTQFSINPMRIMTLLPVLHVYVYFLQSVMIAAYITGPVTKSIIVEVCVIIIYLTISVYIMNATGIIAAVSALTVGRLLCGIYLLKPLARVFKDMQSLNIE